MTEENQKAQEAGGTPAAPGAEEARLSAAELFAKAAEQAFQMAGACANRAMPTIVADHSRNLLLAHVVRARSIDFGALYSRAQTALHAALLAEHAAVCPPEDQGSSPAPSTPEAP